MATVVLVLHLLLALGLIGVVLLQKSEGGGLGMGSSGGFMTGRGTANLLTRTTAILAALFFTTSIGLTLIAQYSAKPVSPLDLPGLPKLQKLPPKGAGPDTTTPAAEPAKATEGAPAAPASAAPASTAPATPAAPAAAEKAPAAPAAPAGPAVPPKSN